MRARGSFLSLLPPLSKDAMYLQAAKLAYDQTTPEQRRTAFNWGLALLVISVIGGTALLIGLFMWLRSKSPLDLLKATLPPLPDMQLDPTKPGFRLPDPTRPPPRSAEELAALPDVRAATSALDAAIQQQAAVGPNADAAAKRAAADAVAKAMIAKAEAEHKGAFKK